MIFDQTRAFVVPDMTPLQYCSFGGLRVRPPPGIFVNRGNIFVAKMIKKTKMIKKIEIKNKSYLKNEIEKHDEQF